MKVWVTILAILIGIAVVWSVMNQSASTVSTNQTTGPQATQQTDDQTAEVEQPTDDTQATDTEVQPPTGPKTVAEIAPDSDAQPDTQATPEAAVQSDQAPVEPVTQAETPADAIPGLHAVMVDEVKPAVIGYDDPKSPFKLRVQFTRYGAAVYEISLSDYKVSVNEPDHYVVHAPLTLPDPSDRSVRQTYEYAYASGAVTINGTRIPLKTNNAWAAGDVVTDDQTSSVTYTATIADADNNPVLKIVRRYSVTVDSYELRLDQQLVNLTDHPLQVRWEQNLQGDLISEGGYMGDRRQYVSGYFALWWDPNKAGIYTQDADLFRSKLVDGKGRDVWPPYGLNPQAELAWIASLNRYFAVVTHAALDESTQTTAEVPPLEGLFPHIDERIWVDKAVADPGDYDKVMVLTAATETLTIPAGQSKNLDLGIFAGPRKPELFAEPPYSTLHLDQTIVYSLGGMCAFCTFQWLAHGLLWLLKLFEGQILVIGDVGIGVHDWGVAIIILVLVVRLLLHPITKRAQINMMKMGKMMQAIQPEVEKLKKKYKDDQQKINAEMMKLYREKGVNPANMLGCLPMFLQTPIWIALYAMLYFAIELRHEPAFWGVFQAVSAGQWGFLQDLSRPDNFLQVLDQPVKLFGSYTFQSINILPLLMAVVFYFQQKLTTPPPANEQQAQQQKMMKFVIFLFPIFLYPAPSGLTLYILASTAAGIIDSTIVRRHIKEQEESGELFKAKPPKPGGLRDRIAKAVEAKQRELGQQQQHKGGKQRKRR